MITKRMFVCIIAGTILGIICIIGAQVRSGFAHDGLYLFSFWFNRLLMGVVIGLAAGIRNTGQTIARGALLGLLVSFAFFSATGFQDIIGFIAGIVYGIIIEYTAMKLAKEE